MLSIPTPQIRQHQIIITLFGLYCRDTEHALPVSVLIAMMGDLGYDTPGVRSAVSRLKSKGVLTSSKDGAVAKYSLAGNLAEMFEEGDEQIFGPAVQELPDGWVLAIFSVPESMRNRRHQLRTVLAGFGFGYMTSGVWIAPASSLTRTKKRLHELELDQFVEFFQGSPVGEADLRGKVSQWWDLETLDQQFSEFLNLYGDSIPQWTQHLQVQGQVETPLELRREAFAYYIPMLTMWRRFPYQAPNLPPEYLTEDWKGPEAREVFLQTHQLIAPLSASYVESLISG